jgi:hypothetical protein
MHSAELASGTIIRLAIASIRFTNVSFRHSKDFLQILSFLFRIFYSLSSETWPHVWFIKALLRLAKCHPFIRGYDPVID